MSENKIEFVNEDGEFKTKEEFLKDVEKLYDEIKDSIDNEECQEYEEGQSFFNIIADPEAQIEPESVLQTYEFVDRSVFITDVIEMSHANSVFELIKFWNNVDDADGVPIEDRKPISIYINTPGGDLDAVFSIIGSIKTSKTPVYTITIGTAYSGGFFIGICGHKRFGLPYSSYLFHEGSSMDGGDAHKFIQRTEFYKQQLKRLKNIVIDNTKISSEEYDEYRKDDWFMDPKEAVRHGVIDEILNDFDTDPRKE